MSPETTATQQAPKAWPTSLPERLLLQLAAELTRRTRVGSVKWERDDPRRDHFAAPAGKCRVLLLHTGKSSDGPESVELFVMNAAGDQVGELKLWRGDDSFHALHELLFQVRCAEDRGGLRTAADDLIGLLSKKEQGEWSAREAPIA